jgi:hypothetical protein
MSTWALSNTKFQTLMLVLYIFVHYFLITFALYCTYIVLLITKRGTNEHLGPIQHKFICVTNCLYCTHAQTSGNKTIP